MKKNYNKINNVINTVPVTCFFFLCLPSTFLTIMLYDPYKAMSSLGFTVCVLIPFFYGMAALIYKQSR